MRNKKLRLTVWSLAFLALALSGCATTYQPANEHFEGGYSDRIADYELILKLSREEVLEIYGHDVLFEVYASGNTLADSNRIETILLGRCGEITLANGCNYFYILDSGGVNSTTFNITSYGSYTTHSYSRSAIIYISREMDTKLERPYNARRYYEAALTLPSPNGHGYITVQVLYDVAFIKGTIDKGKTTFLTNINLERPFTQLNNNIGFNVGFDFYLKQNGFLGFYTKTYGIFNVSSDFKVDNVRSNDRREYFDWEWLGGVQFRIPNTKTIEPFISLGVGFGTLSYSVPESAVQYRYGSNDGLAMPFVLNADIGTRIKFTDKIYLMLDCNFSKYLFMLNGYDVVLTNKWDIMPAIGISYKL